MSLRTKNWLQRCTLAHKAMVLVMRTCNRYTRACLISAPFRALQCCVARSFYVLSSLFVHLPTLSSGASQWRWSMGLLALASGTVHKELAPAMRICTRHGSGDARLEQIHKSLVNMFSITCVAMLRCSLVMLSSLFVHLPTLNSGVSQWRLSMRLWRRPVALRTTRPW